MARDTGAERDAELRALVESARELLHQVRATTAQAEPLREARRALEHAAAVLRPFEHPGPFGQSSLEGRPRGGLDPRDLGRLMPYSPVIGALNPIAPPVRLEFRDGEVHGRARFPSTWAGPSDSVHGGMLAAAFDELLAGVNVANELGAMTGTLVVRYLQPTPLGRELHMTARSTGTEGRKVWARGELRDGERLTAEAEGTFIRRADA